VSWDQQGRGRQRWDRMLAMLPLSDCTYATTRFLYEDYNGDSREKVIFVLWIPDCAKIKAKMLYCGTKDSLKKALQGISVEIGGTDVSELEYESVRERCLAIHK